MSSLKQLIVLLISLVTFVYTFYVMGRFMFFLSAPRSIPKAYTFVFNLLDNKSRIETAYGPIVLDTLYLIGFIFQHSIMKSAFVRDIWHRIGLSSADRSIYSLTSSICLHYLLKNWVSAQSIVLWQVDVDNSAVLWWIFVLVHCFAWAVIYGGTLIMDLPEIIGIKQAYYDIKGYAQPIAYKSSELRHLYAHVRHPSFVGFSVILWSTNLMSLDRLLLGTLLLIYMYFAWSTDRSDVNYQKCQLQRKTQELKSQ